MNLEDKTNIKNNQIQRLLHVNQFLRNSNLVQSTIFAMSMGAIGLSFFFTPYGEVYDYIEANNMDFKVLAVIYLACAFLLILPKPNNILYKAVSFFFVAPFVFYIYVTFITVEIPLSTLGILLYALITGIITTINSNWD